MVYAAFPASPTLASCLARPGYPRLHSSVSTAASETVKRTSNHQRKDDNKSKGRRSKLTWQNLPANAQRAKLYVRDLPHVVNPSIAREKQLRLCTFDFVQRIMDFEEVNQKACQHKDHLQLSSWNQDVLEANRLVVTSLRIDSSYKHFEQGGIELRLTPKTRIKEILQARKFQPGHFVKLIQGELKYSLPLCDLMQQEPWKVTKGILTKVNDEEIKLSIFSLSSTIVESLLSDEEEEPLKNFFLISESEMRIYNAKFQALKVIKREIKQRDEPNKIQETVISQVYKLNSAKLPNETELEFEPVVMASKLDSSQVQAIHKCATNNPISLIHGPPGTGKTTTLAAVILSHVNAGKKVLVTAHSHAACDAISLALLKMWPSPYQETFQENDLVHNKKCIGTSYGQLIRLGNPLRLTVPKLSKWMPSVHDVSKKLSSIRQELADLREDILDPSLRNTRKGEALAAETKLISQMHEIRIKDQTEAIRNAKVVVTTSLNAMMHFSYKTIRQFDLTCIDEAGFASDCYILPLMLRSKKVILSGDHLQLPPVLEGDSAALDLVTDVTLFERLAYLSPASVSLLTKQYRSNQKISGWSSEFFYSCNLHADESVKNSSLTDLDGVKSAPETKASLLFLDTKDMNYQELDKSDENMGDESISNIGEAFLVEEVLLKYVSLGVPASSIGVIAPYGAQILFLQEIIHTHSDLKHVEIRTVDGFQGREKEMIIVSFVRSNAQKDVGFLRETRRINVSVTRAKKCCILIGDSYTLSSDLGLSSLIDYCSRHKAIIPASDFVMS